MHVIIDYGLGNLNSVQKGFERVGIETKISDQLKDIRDSHSLILPGVGAYRDAIKLLKDKGMDQALIEQVNKGKPIIGICLGMQLLFEVSYEYGMHQGLGLIKGEIMKMEIPLKVPHMGWNSLTFNQPNDPILKYINEGDYVYYVHSYFARCEGNNIIAFSDYHIQVPGIVRKDNIYGMQFHPEKSGQVGHNLLKAYKELII